MRVVKRVFFIFYLIFILVNTLLLFTINEFKASSFGNITILGLKNDVSTFSKGDLLFVFRDVKEGDNVLYYDILDNKKVKTSLVNTVSLEDSVVITDDLFLSFDSLIGKTDSVLAIPWAGYLYNLFTGKVGYLIFIVIPILCVFIYQLIKYRKCFNEKN